MAFGSRQQKVGIPCSLQERRHPLKYVSASAETGGTDTGDEGTAEKEGEQMLQGKRARQTRGKRTHEARGGQQTPVDGRGAQQMANDRERRSRVTMVKGRRAEEAKGHGIQGEKGTANEGEDTTAGVTADQGRRS
jgi:hypothetical protein